jgi:tRNA(Arg) A34 adenosine deaminase TadA
MCGALPIKQSRARRVMGIKPIYPRIVLATAVALAVAVSSGAAQTLTNPTPHAETLAPKDAAKSRHTGRVKTCDAYGAGFRNIPGTDACIKIGGSVTVDVGH